MTRINLLKVNHLLDQHLMAEYRELPMVMGSLRRSLKSKKGLTIPKTFRLNTGHVSFFYNKRAFLMERYDLLMAELRRRDFQIEPNARKVDFSVFDKVDCVEWKPKREDLLLSAERILLRVSEKPNFYKYKKKDMPYETYRIRLLERI